MLRFRCPKCRNPVEVEDEQAASGLAACACGQQVRLPDNLKPTAAPARCPPVAALAGIQPAASTPLRMQDDGGAGNYEVVEPEADCDESPRPLHWPGVPRPDGDNYGDFNRYREKPTRRRRRERRDLPTASLILDWITPFTVALVVLGFLSAVLGSLGLFFQGPEIGLVVLGILVFVFGALWFMVYTIQDGEYFFCTFIPGYALLYAARNPDTAGKALLFQFVGVGILFMAGIVTAIPMRRVLALPAPPPPPAAPVFVGPGGFMPPAFAPDAGNADGFVPKERRPAGVKQPLSAKELDGLVACWSLDDEQGDRAVDDSGHGNDGKVRGEWIRGVRGGALWFKGQDDVLDYGAGQRFNFAADAPFTFAGWVQTMSREGVILSQRSSQDGSPMLNITVKEGRIHFQVRDDGDELRAPVELTGGAVDDGEWHHFACVRSKTGALVLYLDGERQGDGEGPSCRGAITTDWRTVGVETLWVKKGGPGQPYLSGCVDEICIFDRELPADDVRKLAAKRGHSATRMRTIASNFRTASPGRR